MVYNFFDKKATTEPSAKHVMGSEIKKDTTMSTAEPSALARSSLILAGELHKPVIKKFKKIKVYSQFKDNIWEVDLADMQSLSKKNKNIKYLFCAIDLYKKYVCCSIKR